MRIKKIINSGRISWSNTKLSELTLWEFYGWQSGELQIWSGSWRVKVVFSKRDECGRVSEGSFTQDRVGVELFISRRNAGEPEKIESRSRKWRPKLDEIGVGIFRAISTCKAVIPLSLKRHLNQLKVVRRFNSLAEGQSELQYSKSELTLSIVYLLLPPCHYTNQMFHHSVTLCMMVLAQQDSLFLLCYSQYYFFCSRSYLSLLSG